MISLLTVLAVKVTAAPSAAETTPPFSVISVAVLLVSTVSLLAVTDVRLMDGLYETASAVATVGLSRNLTPSLNLAGKWIIMITMYLGRVGHLSLALAFNKKQENHNLIADPTEEISVG